MHSDENAPKSPPQSLPGARWRILAHQETSSVEMENQGIIDEVVIDDWLHLEQMNEREWWLRVGDARVSIEIETDGSVRVDIERGAYADVLGTTKVE
jgi:hypothetical protein